MPTPQKPTPRETTEAMVRNIGRELAEIEQAISQCRGVRSPRRNASCRSPSLGQLCSSGSTSTRAAPSLSTSRCQQSRVIWSDPCRACRVGWGHQSDQRNTQGQQLLAIARVGAAPPTVLLPYGWPMEATPRNALHLNAEEVFVGDRSMDKRDRADHQKFNSRQTATGGRLHSQPAQAEHLAPVTH